MSLEKHIRNNRKDFDDQQMSSHADATFEERLRRGLHAKPVKVPQKWRFLLGENST